MDIILFDLGRTLMYFDGPLPDVIEQADLAMVKHLKLAGLDFDEAKFLASFHVYEEDHNNGRGTEFLEFPTRSILKNLLALYGYPKVGDSVIVGAVDALFQITQNYWHPEEDAVPVIKELSKQGYRLGIISNASDDNDVQTLVDKLGVRAYLDVVLSSANVGIRKPNPQIFQIALNRWGASPDQAAMVGDRLDADIQGAHNCGMPGIWITRRADIPAKSELPGGYKTRCNHLQPGGSSRFTCENGEETLKELDQKVLQKR